MKLLFKWSSTPPPSLAKLLCVPGGVLRLLTISNIGILKVLFGVVLSRVFVHQIMQSTACDLVSDADDKLFYTTTITFCTIFFLTNATILYKVSESVHTIKFHQTKLDIYQNILYLFTCLLKTFTNTVHNYMRNKIILKEFWNCFSVGSSTMLQSIWTINWTLKISKNQRSWASF